MFCVSYNTKTYMNHPRNMLPSYSKHEEYQNDPTTTHKKLTLLPTFQDNLLLYNQNNQVKTKSQLKVKSSHD